VAILCNHQKGVSKSHDSAMAKLVEKKEALQAELKDASSAAQPKIRCVAARLQCACARARLTFLLRASCSERLATLERTMDSRESLKCVSLGTSKINYLDPRCVLVVC
jgi:DNA topoisomerase-1